MLRIALFATLSVHAWAQLHLIAGTPTRDRNEEFAAGLFRMDSHAVQQVAELVPQTLGVHSISVSDELRKAVFDAKGIGPTVVLDLDTAEIVKRCEPGFHKAGVVNWWLSNLSGKGPAIEWLIAGAAGAEMRGMLLDPSVPCEKSFPAFSMTDLHHVTARGAAGVGDYSSDDHAFLFMLNPGTGRIQTLDVDNRSIILFDAAVIPEEFRQPLDFSNLALTTSRMAVLRTQAGKRRRTLVYRKRDRTWRELPGLWSAAFTAFGDLLAIAEAKERTSGVASESSAGAAEWRRDSSLYGPDIYASFEERDVVSLGRLHLYNIETERTYTIVTNQADSEILLVEKNIVYYRVSDRLYSAQITDKGIGPARLVAKDEIIRDSHWAFIKH